MKISCGHVFLFTNMYLSFNMLIMGLALRQCLMAIYLLLVLSYAYLSFIMYYKSAFVIVIIACKLQTFHHTSAHRAIEA